MSLSESRAQGARRRVAALLVAAAVPLAALWTLAAVAAWLMLQAVAGAIDGTPSADVAQALGAWADRPWVRTWLDPDEAAALRDGVDWLLGLGGGPAAWLDTALALLGAAIVLLWALGLAGAALAGWGLSRLARAAAAAWRTRAPRSWRAAGSARATGPAVP